MIDDLDRTLAALLEQELPSGLVEQVTVTFATPNDQFPPPSVALPAVDLFLYDLRENRELRRVEPDIERRNGVVFQTPAPVRVDCSYLVTAWASDSSTTPAYDEHRLLGEVMRVLLRHRTLPESVLRGSLRDQEQPPPATTLQSGHLQNLAEFWQALGGRARAALNYTVTLAVPVGDPVALGAPVSSLRLDMQKGVGADGVPDERPGSPP
jgi:hypothetical protein